jgi:hypothetical protein
VQDIGNHCLILITKAAYDSLDANGYHFANPIGDGSSTWMRTEDLVTAAQLAYLKTTFDTKIWSTMSPIWGTPLPRGGEGEKVWILIYNLKDEAYYDATQRSYVAGYFSSYEDYVNTKNMIHIDTYDWIHRTTGTAPRPYLYEGVFAHEYQHLLHADMDADEESWVDEGMADFAAFRCGFLKDVSHVREFMKYHATTSLTTFRSFLEDYGAAYLFQLYLWENYGGDAFTKALFQDQANGIAGVQNELNTFGRRVKFDKVYDDWTLTNYFDSILTGPAKYTYKNINIGPDTNGYTIQYVMNNPIDPGYANHGYFYYAALYNDFGYSPYLELPFAAYGGDFYWEGLAGWGSWPAQPYTSHYYIFNPYKGIQVTLDGADFVGIPAHSGQYQMISGAQANAWRAIEQQFVIPVGDTTAEMSFWINWDTEQDFDYGYIEVYDGSEWTTVPVEDYVSGDPLTIDTLPNGGINPDVPAGRNPEDYYDAGNWNAFNGSSGGYVHARVDLSAFAGKTINVYFRLWQDPAVSGLGLFVDDVTVQTSAATVTTNFETGNGGWVTPAPDETEAWSRGTGMYNNDFGGMLVQYGMTLPNTWRAGISQNPTFGMQVLNTKINAKTQAGTIVGKSIFKVNPNWVYIVSNRADHVLPADYYISAQAK